MESRVQLTCHEAHANCDVSVTMVSYITCRVVECRLQIAIGTTDPKSTVPKEHVLLAIIKLYVSHIHVRPFCVHTKVYRVETSVFAVTCCSVPA